ncbi:MAG: AAA family ATPase [Methylophaga sp.]|uniref:McrB family protein n=1 Tax=Methylophaga sp. TaxID=2024840 RepID=UPI00299CD769|nr:AAA family ATPase [Methylophaga sp.]MDX1751497.1 AAA family ATPase [Methylophaga sp.]
MDGGDEKYTVADLAGYTESELKDLLKSSWGYDYAKPFDVIGQLENISKVDGGSFFVLENLRSTQDGKLLTYPIAGQDVKQNVFVGGVKKSLFNGESPQSKWVKVEVEISPKEQRVKRNNPFSLQAVNGSLELIESIPIVGETVIDGELKIEKWILDFYREKYHKQLVKEEEQLREEIQHQHQQEESKIAELKTQAQKEEEIISDLKNKTSSLSDEVQQHTRALHNITEELAATEMNFNQRKQSMEHKLKTLNDFIEQKASMLLELELIDQAEVDNLLGRESKGYLNQGHDFTDVFSSDPVKAVSYIQAFMFDKGIVYRRKVLEDFFSLLKTHDLIILAGDSGSGKTNLVKSFAEAIGGKAIIVPVKPNWTSAEDLLGYYNPLEQKYLSTPFLDALFEAARNPDVPYLICLDEMNLARVEYYFADFLSLMEERGSAPEIYLYSDTEATHLVSEVKNFLALIDEAKSQLDKSDLFSFLDLLRDEGLNAKLHELCGFREGDSLLKYHVRLRKLMSSYLTTPSSIHLPPNVRIIGAINVDETTHYLSPKILDRAHIVRFGSPLLADWEQIEQEVETFDIDLELPIKFDISALGDRRHYPAFDRNDRLVSTLIYLVREYLEPLGIEFGLRTVRQASHYSTMLKMFEADDGLILNNIVLHKILPKLMFDGEKVVRDSIARKDLLIGMRDYLEQRLKGLEQFDMTDSCIHELDRVISNAQANDWVVNYWSR